MRVLAHAHTSWSHDGRLTLAEWADLARHRRIDAVLLSEHEESGWTPERYTSYVQACQRQSSPQVALVPGIEFLQDGCHVLAFGLTAWPRRPCSAAELARQVESQGSFLCLAHPGKYRWRIPAAVVDAAQAVEVWNSKWIYDGSIGPHHHSLRMSRGKRMLVGQDVHALHHLSNVFLQTAGTAVLADLRAGRYQVEQGGRCWRTDELNGWTIRSLVQTVRLPTVRLALRCYKFVRSAKRPVPRPVA